MHPRSTPTRLPRWGPLAGCVAPPSNIPDILGRRALPSGRLAGLGATPGLSPRADNGCAPRSRDDEPSRVFRPAEDGFRSECAESSVTLMTNPGYHASFHRRGRESLEHELLDS